MLEKDYAIREVRVGTCMERKRAAGNPLDAGGSQVSAASPQSD
jgi:hypothetical protein